MKKIITSLLLVILFSTCGFAQLKIGVIDAQKIIQNSNQGAEIQKRLENRQKNLEAELETIQNKIKGLEKELLSPALNTETRAQKASELETLRRNLQKGFEDAQAEMQRESNKELQNFEREIIPVLNDYGKTYGFTVIFDVSSAGLAFFDATIDVTMEIVKIIDSR